MSGSGLDLEEFVKEGRYGPGECLLTLVCKKMLGTLGRDVQAICYQDEIEQIQIRSNRTIVGEDLIENTEVDVT